MDCISSENGLNANALKIIAILAMTMDHIAIGFIEPNTLNYQLFRMVGKLTIVIMCYMIVEGYKHTHNIKKYLTRLFIFAIISHVPFVFLNTGKISLLWNGNNFQTSVIWTLFLGLASLYIWNYDRLKKPYKIILSIIICALSMVGDWNIFAILLIWGFSIFYENRKIQMIFLGVLAMWIVLVSIMTSEYWYNQIYNLGLLLNIPILLIYNGKLGKSKHLKWLFYIYYPLHMVVLGIMKYL